LLVDAVINCDILFEIPINSQKNLLNNADSALLKKKTSELGEVASLMKMLINSNIKKPEPEEEKPKLVTSPQSKRKNKDDEEPELCELTNKAFTTTLRKGLEKIADDNGDDYNRTVGYYSLNYPDEVNKLKLELGKFVPKDWTFKDSWRKATAAISQERCSKKSKNNKE